MHLLSQVQGCRFKVEWGFFRGRLVHEVFLLFRLYCKFIGIELFDLLMTAPIAIDEVEHAHTYDNDDEYGKHHQDKCKRIVDIELGLFGFSDYGLLFWFDGNILLNLRVV